MILNCALVGLLAGSAILIGALLGMYLKVGNKVVAAVMAFGAGVLISALSIDLLEDAFDKYSNAWVMAAAFVGGALVFVGGDWLIDSKGGKFRRHSHAQTPEGKKQLAAGGNIGLAILLGTILDGIPESFVVGASLSEGGTVGWVFIAAVFLSNLPEGMSGTMGMKLAGMPNARIWLWWLITLLITVIASICGGLFLAGAPDQAKLATVAFASGAILAMLCDTMIPEAFKFGGRAVALITVVGFLLSFLMSKLF